MKLRRELLLLMFLFIHAGFATDFSVDFGDTVGEVKRRFLGGPGYQKLIGTTKGEKQLRDLLALCKRNREGDSIGLQYARTRYCGRGKNRQRKTAPAQGNARFLYLDGDI